MSTSNPHNARLNTLKLDQRDLVALDEKFTESHPSKGTRADREHTRFEYLKTRVVLEIVHPDGNRVKMPVVSRNLSRRGIALLHSAYVHVGSNCVVYIFSPTFKKWVRVPGEVTRCEHRSGTAHEVGIRFENEINTREILDLDPMGGKWTRERVDLARLRGRLLVVDSDDLVQRLIAGLLKKVDVEIIRASTPEEAIEKASGCDLILCEYYLGESTGPEFTMNLRNTGLMTPVLLMTGDQTEAIRDEMLCAGAAGFLSKPLTSHALHQALAEFMLDSTSSDSGQIAMASDDPRAELIEPFISSLTTTAREIQKALESEDTQTCMTLCRNVASQAPSLGFVELGNVATAAMTQLGLSEHLNESSRELAHLIGLCLQTKAKPLSQASEPSDAENEAVGQESETDSSDETQATDQAA